MPARRKKGEPVQGRYKGGQMYSRPKQQFCALYKHVGTFRLAVQLAPDLVLWPQDYPVPDESTLRVWAWEFETGIYLPHEKIDKNMERKLAVYPKWRQFQMIEQNIQANEKLTGQLKDGTFNEKWLPALAHTSTAVNFGVQAQARAEQASSGNKQTINFNNFKMLTNGNGGKKKQPGLQPKNEVKVLSVGKPDR